MLVQTLRLQHGWTQEQLATVSGVGVRTIQRLERGQTVSDETLKSLAAVFDVDFRALKEPIMTAAVPIPADTPDAARHLEEMLAFEHVRQVKRFHFHLIAWVVMVGAMAAINVFLTPKYPWVVFPAGFWAAALGLRALRLFTDLPFGAAWERRQVERRLGRSL